MSKRILGLSCFFVLGGAVGMATADTLVDMPAPPSIDRPAAPTESVEGGEPDEITVGDVALARYSGYRGRPRNPFGFEPAGANVGWYPGGGGYIRSYSFLPYPYSLNGWGYPWGGYGWGGYGWRSGCGTGYYGFGYGGFRVRAVNLGFRPATR